MAWLRKHYPVGKEFEAPDPDMGKPASVTVTGYWRNTMSRDTGIYVKTADGREFNISAGYLWEDGNGVYDPPRSPGRPHLSVDAPTVKIEITLPATLRDKLDGMTDNRSAWVRSAIEAADGGNRGLTFARKSTYSVGDLKT